MPEMKKGYIQNKLTGKFAGTWQAEAKPSDDKEFTWVEADLETFDENDLLSTEEKIININARLYEIDILSIRPLREGDTVTLATLDAEAVTLRAERDGLMA